MKKTNLVSIVLSLLIILCFIGKVNAQSLLLENSKNSNGSLPAHWINGEDCSTEIKGQVHQYNQDLFIIRQSICTNFEAPFMFLIFGQSKVLMLDSGASDFGQRDIADGIINKWLELNNKKAIDLIIAHTHGHGDHIAGDDLFKNRPNTVVIETSVNSVIEYFNLNQWPSGVSSFDLGDRKIDILPLPGHQDAHIAVYDYKTGILFTGDSLYPGRLYFKQSTFSQYKKSMQNLYKYIQEKRVKLILGTHIEMTESAGKDYPFQASEHKKERQLQLSKAHLKELIEALSKMQLPVKKQIHDDFILYPTD